jgi:hypothetical protein
LVRSEATFGCENDSQILLVRPRIGKRAFFPETSNMFAEKRYDSEVSEVKLDSVIIHLQIVIFTFVPNVIKSLQFQRIEFQLK